MLYDTDWGFGYNGKQDYKTNLLDKATKVGSVGVLFSSLLKNKSFQIVFKNQFNYFITTNFNLEKVLSKMNEMKNVLSPEMQEHIYRWRVIGTYSKWLSNVDEMQYFAKNRTTIQLEQLTNFLDSYTKITITKNK